MKTITVSKNINAPVEKVFNTVAHIEEFSKTVSNVTKIEFLSEQKTGAGTRFRETRLMKGKEASTELEVTEYIKNEKVRLVAENMGTVWDTTFSVKQVNGGTILTMAMDAKSNNFFAGLMNVMIRGMIAKEVEKDMDAVKVYCEK